MTDSPQAGVGPRPSVAGSPSVHSSGSDSASSDGGDTTDEEKSLDAATTGSGDISEQVSASYTVQTTSRHVITGYG